MHKAKYLDDSIKNLRKVSSWLYPLRVYSHLILILWYIPRHWESVIIMNKKILSVQWNRLPLLLWYIIRNIFNFQKFSCILCQLLNKCFLFVFVLAFFNSSQHCTFCRNSLEDHLNGLGAPGM